MQLNYTDKVQHIADLVKLIGDLKHSFESASDIQKLNNTELFQDLVHCIFGCKYDCELCNRNTNDERLVVAICKHNDPIFIVSCFVYKKYKRKPFHIKMFFMSNKSLPIYNQHRLANWVLDDSVVFSFFK